MRALKLALALAIAGAFPSAADPLPPGEFLIAARLMPEDFLPRYVTLNVDGDRIDLILSSRLPLDYQACGEDRSQCVYRQTAATATATLINGTLELSDVTIHTDAVLEEQFRQDEPLHTLITAPLIDLLNKAVFEETEHGFTLTSNGTPLPLYRATEAQQQAIMVFPFMTDLSIRSLDGCEVATIAPMFDVGESAFTDALIAAARVHDLQRLADEFDPIIREASEAELEEARALRRLATLPRMLAFTTEAGPFATRVDALWDSGIGQTLFDNDRAAYDAALTRFGPQLEALVAFQTHLSGTAPEITSRTACADPSFGFIAAQGG